DGSAACGCDFLQLAPGEERNPLTIRRKERATRIISACERGRLQLIETTDVKLRCLARTLLRSERQQLAVWRKHSGSSDVDCQRRVSPDVGVHAYRWRWHLEPPGWPRQEYGSRGEPEDTGNRPRQSACSRRAHVMTG